MPNSIMKQLHLICFFVSLNTTFGALIGLSEDYQLTQDNVNLEDHSNDNLKFSIISQYLPFGSVRQIGSIGLFDSHCMILTYIQGSKLKNTIFLYYDCIDQEEKKLQKFVEFIGYDGKIYNYKITIPNLDYENHWYVFTFLYIVNLKMVFIAIQNYADGICFKTTEDLMLPFIETSFKITTGGGFSIEENSILIPFKNTKQFSFFPGKIEYEIYIEKFMVNDIQDAKNQIYKDYSLLNREICQCESNYISNFEINLQNLDTTLIAPEYRNCDKFSVQFWIKFDKIFQQQTEFIYQLFNMHQNTKDKRLLNENLSAFQLFYKISKLSQNKIIFTTYSFDLPAVNLDFQQNQFLKTREFELGEDYLYSWQSVSIVLDQNLNVQIKIYKNQQIISYIDQQEVNHFHQTKFFMELGNLLKKEYDYINFQLFSFIFDNCETHSLVKVCHSSCLECDGPSKNDCLTCSQESNRIYFQQYKVCICPYNMVDNGEICLNSDNLSLSFINYGDDDIITTLSCKYGYYQGDQGSCVQCPTMIKNYKITCLECILNPLSWKLRPVCDLIWIFDEKLETFLQLQSFENDKSIVYQYDGDVITMCDWCNEEQDIYGDFKEANTYFKQFCQISWRGQQFSRFGNLDPDKCYNYKGQIECDVLKLEQTEFSCQSCNDLFPIINGQCFYFDVVHKYRKTCTAPYYINSQFQCVKCNILNCDFCFEYQIDDLNYSTLYQEFKGFSNDSQYSIGCALCENGYQFNFITGYCESQNIQIQHCLRSFINQKNEEICTLSDVLDFSVSSEIINCEVLILNCLQCLKNPFNIIECIICKPGYCQSSMNNCELSTYNYENVETCFEGQWDDGDNNYDFSQVTVIKSFLMSFLPNNYYYTMGAFLQQQRIKIPYKCNQNFALNRRKECVPYCDSNCLECTENLSTFLFECKKCQLDYFKKRIVSQFYGKCIECPQLCLICHPRTQDQIKLINPYFVVNEQNEKYTYQCTKHIENANITIDNNLIAQYNFQKNCIQIQYNIPVGEPFKYQDPASEFYNNQVNIIKFANQMGIKCIQLLFMLPSETLNKIDIEEINLKAEVFSLEKATLILQGKDQLFNYLFVKILYFDEIIINQTNMYFNFKPAFLIRSAKYIFQNQDNTLQLRLMDLTFESYSNSIEAYFNFNLIAQKLELFYVQNFEFKNFYIIESTIFFLEFYQIQNQDVFLINIKIQNCSFVSSTIFKFINSQYNFRVQNFSIENCEFINSSIFNIETNQSVNNFFFSNISIQKSIFKNSLFVRSLTGKLEFINFTLTQNEFYYSKAMEASQDLQLYNIYSISNYFFESDLINSIRENNFNINEHTQLKNFQFKYNQVFNFKLFLSLQNSVQLQLIGQIIFDQVIFEQNKQIFPLTKELSLIQIDKAKVQCHNIQIINSDPLQYFNLTQVQKVSFINFTMENDQFNSTVPISFRCMNFEKGMTQLLNLYGFASLHFENISIINQISIDLPFIKITSTQQFFIEMQELILVKNLNFHNNLLFKTQSNIILSSFAIYSQNPQKMEFQNINFVENIFHQIVDDVLTSTASLIYVDSAQSYCLFYNINLSNNYLTNSSSSFIFIQAHEIFLEDIIVTNHNVITPQLLNKHYNIELKGNISNNLINEIFKSILQVKNIGGFCQLATEKVTIMNSYFYNIRAQSSAICQITTKGEGFVKILNSVIRQIMTDITMSIILFGGFGIDSFDSLLNLQIQNVTFIENFNKFGSSILSIVPSQKQNIIKITDIVIRNCLSLLSSVFSFEFTGQSTATNNVKIANLSFSLNEQSWIKYFNLIQDINSFDIQKILSSNSIISVSGSEIELSNLFFTGVILGQILKTINLQKITVKFVRIYDIQQIYPDDLMFFGQDEQNQEKMIIFSSEIRNFSQYYPNNSLIISNQKFIFYNAYDKCKLNNDDFQIFQQDKNYITYISIFQKQFTSLGSIIYFSTSSHSTLIKIIKLNIKGNNCNRFSSALRFNLNFFDQIKISELSCTYNTFQKLGCLYFYSLSYFISPIKVKNSFFFLNEGSSGGALYAENVNLQISDCYFMNNSATEEGGAIQYYGKNLTFKNSYLLFNKALIGGGLTITSNYFMNLDQLKSLFLQFNKATFVSDNILSYPTHLALMVNNMKIPSKMINFDNYSMYQLSLKPYTTIEQQYKIQTQYLELPTNQIIGEYYLLNPKNLQYFKQIFSIKLTLRNIYDEILPNNFDFQCQVSQGILNILDQSIQDEAIISELEFDLFKSQFNFDKLKIIQDPYLMENNFIILNTKCSIGNQILTYQVVSKMYKCQLGEYYIENIGCQLCNSIQGYYSVKYNVTKCSLFDKTKYKNVTSNQIELLPGFWRSSKYSDITEFCFKNQRTCLGGWHTGNELCSQGHLGGLCEECDILNMRGDGHYFKDSQNQECWDCEKSASGLIGFSLILLWSMFSTFLTLSSVKVSNKLFSSLISMQKYGKIIFKLNQDHKGFLIKMLINYLWIFSAIFTFNITFSFQVNVVEQVSNPSVFMANSLDCLYRNLPAFPQFILEQLLCFYNSCLISSYSNDFIIVLLTQKETFRTQFIFQLTYLFVPIKQWSNYKAVFVKLYFRLSSLLTTRLISDVFYVSGEVSLLYYRENHLNWLKYFILPSLIVFSLIIPLILLFLLLINQNKLDSIKVRKHLGYLFNEYKEVKFYWELIKILKQSLIILFLIMFETQILLKAIILGCVLNLYQIFVAQLEPFIIKNFNKLDLQSGQLCCVGMFFSAVKFYSEQQQNIYLTQLFQVIIVFLLLRICSPFISQILTIYLKNEKIQILKKILRIVSCIKSKSTLTKYLSNYIEKLENNKTNLIRNLGKIRQTFLNKKDRILTFPQRIQNINQIRLLEVPQGFSSENLKQKSTLDQNLFQEKNE